MRDPMIAFLRTQKIQAAPVLWSALLLPLITGCDPEVDLFGVYVPGWIIAGIAGTVISYVATTGLRKALGDLLDLWRICLAIILAGVIHWLCFAK